MANDNAKKQKFIDLLHELFQLNQPELDFGLYRIMHAKSGQIKAFIENDLSKEIDQAFADGGNDKVAELKAAYEHARAQAVEFGIADPDDNAKVKEAKEHYDAAREGGDDPSEIYDHLYRFFSRYYDKGDFLSRRYHVAENDSRAAPYAVPYDGREVYLHWANKDQYYIKSSEYLSNFSFDLTEALKKERKRQGIAGQDSFDFETDEAQQLKVTFQLVEAAEGAHNNVKENQSRFFIIHADNPIVQGESELTINFEYRPDGEKSGQEGTWQKKRLEEAEAIIVEALKKDAKAKRFHDALAFLAPTEKQKERILLGKYLASYTARNTMDYFIHKDLGGFLRRELDFYIKNEIMRLDDLNAEDVTGVTRSLKKITALRTIARQIIDFLAQLEEFQKKLWLKKKFVTEVNYCITLDRIPEVFYDEIASNERQWKRWEELGFITKDKARSKETLTANPYMMVDTGLCEEGFKARLLAKIEGLDEQCDGLLVNAENFQAMNMIRQRLHQQVKLVYIDPPYNTGNDGFAYKDSYQSSSWLSMIQGLAPLTEAMTQADDAFFAMSVDKRQLFEGKMILASAFSKFSFVNAVVNVNNPKGRSDQKHLPTAHDNVVLFATDGAVSHGWKPGEKVLKRYRKQDSEGEYREIDLRKTGDNDLAIDRPKMAYPFAYNKKTEDLYPLAEGVECPEDYLKIFPMKDSQTKGRWRWELNTSKKNISRLVAKYQPTKRQWTVFEKDYLGSDERVFPTSVWDEKSFNSERGTEIFIDLGFDKDDFPRPKPVGLMCQLIEHLNRDGVYTLDYFAGSGTTGHAVLELNRQDKGKRKYILVEVGDYFDAVLRPRMEKVVYSDSWKNGKPTSRDTGISHCFKYLRLESYEDSLNNLMLDRDKSRTDMLAQDDSTRLRKDYLLHYFLKVETRGSASLLNVEQFRDPTAYTLMVKKPGSDAQVPVKVDLVETFNWLIGLEVALLDRPRTYAAEFEREKDPELPEDQHTRLKVARFKEADEGAHWFRIVEGYVRRTPGSDADKEKVMVVWRKLTDDPEQDAAVLEALLEKYRVNQADSEFDKIYINGPHGLSLSGQAKARLLNLEETFMARMWEGTEQGALH